MRSRSYIAAYLVALSSLTLSGCIFRSFHSDGTTAEGKFIIPRTVLVAGDTPSELLPYLPRFEEVIEYYSYYVGETSDPRALKLQLSYRVFSDRTEIDADILQYDRPIIHTYAYADNPKANPPTAALIDDLANRSIEIFQSKFSDFVVSSNVENESHGIAGVSSTEAPPPIPKATPSSGSAIVGFGTAFAVNSPTTYMTAFHVVSGASKIELYCGSGDPSTAEVVYADQDNDLAVLRSDHKAKTFLTLAPASGIEQGEHVFTFGFPTPDILGLEPKYSDGAISALSGMGDTKSEMQISVPIQPGNSGGPLVDDQGRVVGIVTATVAPKAFIQNTDRKGRSPSHCPMTSGGRLFTVAT